MIRRWICLRRLRPSHFTCLCLFVCAALLTLTSMLQKTGSTRSDVFHSEFQRLAHTHRAVYENKTYERAAQHLPGHGGSFFQDDSNVAVKGSDFQGLSADFSRNAPSKIQSENYNLARHFSNTLRENIQKDGSLTDKTTWNFTQSNSSNLEQFLLQLSSVLTSQAPYTQLEIIRNILNNLTESTNGKERFLKTRSYSNSLYEHMALTEALVKLTRDERFSEKMKSQLVSLLLQITGTITSPKALRPVLHRAHPKSRFKHTFYRNLNANNETSSITNTGQSDIGNGDLKSDIFRLTGKSSITNSSLVARMLDSKRLQTSANSCDSTVCVTDGIYWSQEVEDRIPKGISNQTADKWINKSRTMGFHSLQSSSWYKCGRPKNAFALFEDRSKACVRYRSPNDRLIQGEIMSYWLARLLALDNVPPVSLASLDSGQWSPQKNRFHALQWEKGNYVATIMWVEEVTSSGRIRVLMPDLILKAYRQKQPVDGRSLKFLKLAETNNHVKSQDKGPRQEFHVEDSAVSLAQWGSLFIFDYLTGNYDRVASMQDGAEAEKKPSIIEEPIRNLRKSKNREKLWLIDNESGLLDAYDLMYRSTKHQHRFIRFHEEMLHTMCVFQRQVVERLLELHKQKRPHKILEKFAEKQEPLLRHIERDSSYELFAKYFSERLEAVVNWISLCEKKAKDN